MPAETKLPKPKLVLKGHTDPVYQVRFSPDGSWLVTAAFDKTLRIWDAKTGKSKRTLEGHTRNVFAVAISKDGKQIASGSDDNTIKLWDVKPKPDPKKKTATAYSASLTGHRSQIMGVAFSPDGKQLASCSSDKTVRLWDVAGKKALKTLSTQPEAVYAIAFTPKGKQLVTAGADKTVRLFNADPGTEVRKFAGPEHPVYTLALHPNGSRIAAAGMGVGGTRDIYLWKIDKAEPEKTIAAHADDIYRVAFNPKGSRLLSIGYAGHVKIWDAASGKNLFATKLSSVLYSGAWSPDGKRIAVASSDAHAYVFEVPANGR